MWYGVCKQGGKNTTKYKVCIGLLASYLFKVKNLHTFYFLRAKDESISGDGEICASRWSHVVKTVNRTILIALKSIVCYEEDVLSLYEFEESDKSTTTGDAKDLESAIE